MKADHTNPEACNICPRMCGVDRSKERGFCGAGDTLRINLAQLHHGEEPCISGSRGSGTIFFAHCNLKCVFCQNHVISIDGNGKDYSPKACAELMLKLQSEQAHNINLVTPSHYTPQIKESILLARESGLQLPIVWNSNAYEHVDVLRDLEGLVNVYLPDLKYAHGFYAAKYSHAVDYPDIALKAIAEMSRQTGTPRYDREGIMTRGLIIRLLVLPNNLAGISASLDRIAESIGTDVMLSLMAQYYPTHLASRYPEISRGITPEEYEQAVESAMSRGFDNLYCQELSCSDEWTPDFHRQPDDYTQMESQL